MVHQRQHGCGVVQRLVGISHLAGSPATMCMYYNLEELAARGPGSENRYRVARIAFDGRRLAHDIREELWESRTGVGREVLC